MSCSFNLEFLWWFKQHGRPPSESRDRRKLGWNSRSCHTDSSSRIRRIGNTSKMYKLVKNAWSQQLARVRPLVRIEPLSRMKVRAILKYPHASLQLPAEPVMKMTEDVWRDIEDLLDTFYYSVLGARGLAAPQINICRRIIVVDVGQSRTRNPLVLINPILEDPVGRVAIWETCLSLPQLEIKVPRAKLVTVRAKNLEGECVKLETENLVAVTLQHEVDHLNGRLLLDYLPLKSREEWCKRLT